MYIKCKIRSIVRKSKIYTCIASKLLHCSSNTRYCLKIQTHYISLPYLINSYFYIVIIGTSLKRRFLPLTEILFHQAMRLHLPSGSLDLGKFIQDVRLRWQNDRKGLENENVCKGKLKRKCSETLNADLWGKTTIKTVVKCLRIFLVLKFSQHIFLN